MNPLRKALHTRTLTCGGWIQMGHPAVGEVFAAAGFDWVCVDLEHGAMDLGEATNLFRAIEARGGLPVARLPANDPVWIHRVLDAGAQGLIIPMVNTAAQAEAAVQEAKYPPRGKRGFGYSRANDHGRRFDAYRKAANDEIPLIMQIEHKDAMTNLGAILDVDGVDGVFIGPLDLSGSMGITGELRHPDMLAALQRYREEASARGKAYGLHIVRPDPEQIQRAIAEGYTLLALGLDNVFLEEAVTGCLSNVKRITG